MFALRRSSTQAHRSKKWLFTLTNLTLHTLLLTSWAASDSRALDDTDLSSESNTVIEARITGGKTAPPERFPYTCSLRERGTHRHMCGATLFRRDWVLTAAHCVDPNSRPSIGLSPIVYCGIHDRKKAQDDQVFDAIAGYVHPKWTGDVAHGHDVAVLKLDRDANLTLPRLGSGNVALDKGGLLAATGWGNTDSGVPAKKLQVTAKLAVVGQDKCIAQPQGVDPKSWICAGGLQQDTCKGDSGGPLLLMDAPYGSMDDGKARLDLIIGITSFGYREDDDAEPCSGIEPAIYTSVDYFLDWIEWIIDCHPDCSGDGGKWQWRLTERRKHYAILSESDMISEMFRAIKEDNPLDAEALLLSGLYANATFEVDKSRPQLKKGSTLLHAAAVFDAPLCAEVLIKHKAGIDTRNADGETALHATAIYDSVEATKVLLHHGADMNAFSRDDRTPLHFAVQHKSFQIVKLLVAHGADMDTSKTSGWTPVHEAARFRYDLILKILLDAGADVDVFYEGSWTPLHEAVNYGFVQTVKILIEAGANVNTANDASYTLLHTAAEKGYTELVKILVDAGADVDVFERRSWTPLQIAVKRGFLQITKILIKAGANVNTANLDDWTPLHTASNHGHLNIAKVLVAAGASKSNLNKQGNPPRAYICGDANAHCSEQTRKEFTKLLAP